MPHEPRGPASLLAALPAHLGRALQPPEAVVLGWADDAPGHVVVATLNLRDGDPLDEVELARSVVVDGAERATVVVAVSALSDNSPPTAASHARFVASSLQRFGVDVLDAVTIVGDRWRSLACLDPTCCPPEGRPVPSPTPTEETS
jgi:hypothetical protein